MKRKRGTFVGLGLLEMLSILSLAFTAQAYDSNAASDYAFNGYNQYNPGYNNYQDDSIYHEDANFVSQSLIAGGLLNSSNIPLLSYLDDKGCIPSREALAEFLKDYEHAKKVGFKVDLFVPTSLAWGDVVFFGDDSNPHKFVGIITGYNPVWDDFVVAYHTNTSGGVVGAQKSLAELTLVYGGATFYHITKPEETTDKQRFYGTGNFLGEDSLSVEMLRPGDNFKGYIISNSNRSEQDMVIATDTSQAQYKGCSYLIAGYCCDPEKHTPSLGQTFGPPWTSDSPTHWAYWVRQAVLYGTAQGFGAQQILNAVWYIVDRAGYPDDIITTIGYPADGPMKWEVVYLPLVIKPAVGLGDKAVTPLVPVMKPPPRPLKDFSELYERKRSRTR
jgi:hypothetical protein